MSTYAARILPRLWWVVSAVLMAVVVPAGAVSVTGLYSVEVPVESSRPADLQEGYAEGLRQVFLRVSGSRDVFQNEGVDDLLADAETLLQSYQFLRGDGGEGNRLRMTFGAVGVNKALASVDAPVWGANRPLTLAWIAVEERGSRQLVLSPENASQENADQEMAGQWSQAVLEAAAQRGLPVSLPPASFRGDRELLSDIWGQFTASVKRASENLSHDQLALVRISRTGDRWRAGWVLDGMDLEKGERSITAESPEELAAGVIGHWADAFADRYAVAAGEVGESPQVEMVVHGVSSLQDYSRVNDALEDLTPVVQVGAARVLDDQLTLRVAFSGELEQLKEYLALDARFIPFTDSGNTRPQATPALPESGAYNPPQANMAGQGDSEPASEQGSAGTMSDPLFIYQPLLGNEQESEQAFESLYQVLHYRWQPASVVEVGNGK